MFNMRCFGLDCKASKATLNSHAFETLWSHFCASLFNKPPVVYGMWSKQIINITREVKAAPTRKEKASLPRVISVSPEPHP